MFHDTSVTDYDPTLPRIAPVRRRRITDGVSEPEPLVVICFVCRSVRDDAGGWATPTVDLADGGARALTHGLCPSCLERLYPEPVEAVG